MRHAMAISLIQDDGGDYVRAEKYLDEIISSPSELV
jgi:hypothetical protein